MRFVVGHRSCLVALFALLALLPAFANPYIMFVANMLMLYMLLALGLNLLLGYAGQFALANAAMFGIGAYGAALLQVKLGWPYWAAAPSGALLAMLIGTALAFPALRLSGIYLALATLAFALVTQWVLLHWESVTFGAGGFAAPALDLSPLPIGPDVAIYYLTWIVTIALIALAWSIVRSRIGRAFVAIRDGEVAAQALGINLLKYKAIAFALSGFYAGTAGALYPPLLGYVAPESFDLFQLVIQKSMVVVGGIGSIMGSIVGATLMVVVLEVLREFKAAQEIIFGAVLIAFVIFQPHGVVALFRKLPGWEEPLNSAASVGRGGDHAKIRERPAPELAADERP